jgi:hypothetical protein
MIAHTLKFPEILPIIHLLQLGLPKPHRSFLNG